MKIWPKTYHIILLLFYSLIFSTTAFTSENEKNLWVVWEVNAPISDKQINHRLWQKFISKYVSKPVDGLSLVEYARVTSQDHTKLKHYIDNMRHIKIGMYQRKEQLAYWLNLYNALIVNLILENYPVKSIQDINISPGLFSSGPWDADLIKIGKFNLSLNDIQNRIIRPIWNDPRTLYALCNSAIGGPNIYPQAFQGHLITEQLNRAAQNYINSPRGVQIIQRKLIVSQLYDWYEEDFGGSKQAVLNHIKLYAHPKLKKKLATFSTINNYIYNWHLNTQRQEK